MDYSEWPCKKQETKAYNVTPKFQYMMSHNLKKYKLGKVKFEMLSTYDLKEIN